MVDPVFSETGQWGRAHNDYVQSFAELGLVGLFFMGWLLVASMKTSIALLSKEMKGEQRYLMMGVILALGGLFVTAFFSFPFQTVTSTFIFAIYLAARGRSTFSELRWYPPMEAAKGSAELGFSGQAAGISPNRPLRRLNSDKISSIRAPAPTDPAAFPHPGSDASASPD